MTVKTEVRRLISRWLWKPRVCLQYPVLENSSPPPWPAEDVLVFEGPPNLVAHETHSFTGSWEYQRFIDVRRRNPESWVLFVLVQAQSVIAFSSLHVPSQAAEWLDSLPTFPGEARESGTFVEPNHRGRGWRGELLQLQMAHCAQHRRRMWAVVETSNQPSLKSSFKAGARVVRRSGVLKCVGYNVLSVTTNPVRLYVNPKRRKPSAL